MPGSSAADSTEIFQEGLRIPILKLYERGVPNQTLMDMIALNVRIPDVVLGDLQAQAAACRIAERGIGELAARFGVDELERYFDDLLDYSEREARRTVRSIPPGIYRFVDYLDDDGVNMDEPVRIAVAIHVDGDELTVDLDGHVAAGARRDQLDAVVREVGGLFRRALDHGLGRAEQFRVLPSDPRQGAARLPGEPETARGGRRARHQRLSPDRRDVRRAGAGDPGARARSGRGRHHELQLRRATTPTAASRCSARRSWARGAAAIGATASTASPTAPRTSATRRSRWSRTRPRSASSTTSSFPTAAARANGAAACRCRASCVSSARARRCSCARTAAGICLTA